MSATRVKNGNHAATASVVPDSASKMETPAQPVGKTLAPRVKAEKPAIVAQAVVAEKTNPASPAKPANARGAAKAATPTSPAGKTNKTVEAKAKAATPPSGKTASVKKARVVAAPTAKPGAEKAAKPAKAKKMKLVRDSFAMPESEYAQFAAVKKRCLSSGLAARKSEVLRAALAGLAALDDAAIVAAIRRLDLVKTGRPGK